MHAMSSTAIAVGALLLGSSALYIATHARKALRWLAIMAAAPLAVAVSIPPTPAMAASFPPLTYSRYITPSSLANSSSGVPNMFTMGCNQGRASDSEGQPRQIVLMNFGDPGWNNAGTFGAYPGPFVPMSTIETAVENYMQAFWDCTVAGSHSFMIVAPGVTNANGGVTYGTGQAWGQMIGDLVNWISNRGYGAQLYAAGAWDVEPGWNGVGVSEAWLNGLMSTLPASHYYYDFGSADDCPPFGSCSNGWTQADVYHVAWGAAPALAVPQIYVQYCNCNNSAGQAREWQQVSLWGAVNAGYRINFSAALSQSVACADMGDSCYLEDNSPQDSWNMLLSYINSDSRTSGSIPYSTVMSYQAT